MFSVSSCPHARSCYIYSQQLTTNVMPKDITKACKLLWLVLPHPDLIFISIFYFLNRSYLLCMYRSDYNMITCAGCFWHRLSWVSPRPGIPFYLERSKISTEIFTIQSPQLHIHLNHYHNQRSPCNTSPKIPYLHRCFPTYMFCRSHSPKNSPRHARRKKIKWEAKQYPYAKWINDL